MLHLWFYLRVESDCETWFIAKCRVHPKTIQTFMTRDEQSICQVVKQLETSWNAGDSAAFAGVFAQDADFVDILGRHHKGRATIEAGHRQIFGTIYRDSRNTYTVKEVRFLQPNIAIAFVHSRLLSRVGGAVDQAGGGLRRM
jgi:uncharacterized protein (TIGR02246 family)